MKNLKYILYIFLILSIFSCSEKIDEQVLPSVSLECSISGIVSASSTKTYNKTAVKASVPDFISGVSLTVENLDYDVSDAVKSLYFDSMDADVKVEENMLSLELNGIVVGRNRITAKGICKNEALSILYSDIDKFDAEDLNVRASQYADYLMQKHPMYANYFNKGEIIKQITTSNNSVNIPMTSDSHRLAVVLENSTESKYLLKITVEDDLGNIVIASDDYIGIGSQIAMVINDNDAKGEKEYTVTVRCFSKNSNIEFPEYQKEKTIRISERVNSTKLYVFSKDELLESEGNFAFNWELMEEVDSGEILD